jgi:hypothetical protein
MGTSLSSSSAPRITIVNAASDRAHHRSQPSGAVIAVMPKRREPIVESRRHGEKRAKAHDAVETPAYQAPTAIMMTMVKVETHAIAAGTLYHSGVFIVASRAVAHCAI